MSSFSSGPTRLSPVSGSPINGFWALELCRRPSFLRLSAFTITRFPVAQTDVAASRLQDSICVFLESGADCFDECAGRPN